MFSQLNGRILTLPTPKLLKAPQTLKRTTFFDSSNLLFAPRKLHTFSQNSWRSSPTTLNAKESQNSVSKNENSNVFLRFFGTLIKTALNNPGMIKKRTNTNFTSLLSSGGKFPKDIRRLIQVAKETTESSTANAAPQKPVLSDVDMKRLEDLKNQATQHPTDATKQFYYVQELNRVKDYQAVVDHCKTAIAIGDDVRREQIKALVHLGQFDQIALSSFSSAPGGSPNSPLYTTVITNESWLMGYGRIAYYIISAVFALSIIYWLLSGSKSQGGLGELMNSNYNAIDTASTTTFNDVKGNEEAKEELSDLVEYLKNPNKFAHMGAKLPKGVLLVGPPGCGKTLVAKALAGEANVPFYYTSGSEFEEMLVGVGARRVRALFNKAKESAPCIIFIDEIDALGAKRDAMDTRSSKMSLNQLLVELDGFQPSTGVIVVAATNMPESLDPALTRPGRFDRQVTVDLPDVKARKDILELYLGNKRASDVDIEGLAKATVGFSGAELFNMVNSALIQAVKKNMFKVNNALLVSAKETVQMGPERKSLTLTPETKNITAFHEAGHALISLLHKKPIVKATLVPRGHALGMVSYLPKDEMLTKKEDMLGHLDTAMGGRIAEEITFGPDKVTQGAGSDFKQATRLAYTMVASYGMSDKLGHFSFSERELSNLSPDTRALIDAEVKEILETSYQRAKKVLLAHRVQLNSLANALLEFETLTEEEVRMAFEGKDLKAFKAAKAVEDELLKKAPAAKPHPGVEVDVSTPTKPNLS